MLDHDMPWQAYQQAVLQHWINVMQQLMLGQHHGLMQSWAYVQNPTAHLKRDQENWLSPATDYWTSLAQHTMNNMCSQLFVLSRMVGGFSDVTAKVSGLKTI